MSSPKKHKQKATGGGKEGDGEATSATVESPSTKKSSSNALVSSLKSYCESVLPPLWGLSDKETSSLSNFLSTHEQANRIMLEFVDTQMASLCIAAVWQRNRETEDHEGTLGFRVSQSALYDDGIVAQVLLLKLKDHPLHSKLPLRSQLQITQLGTIATHSFHKRKTSSDDDQTEGKHEEENMSEKEGDAFAEKFQPQDVLYSYVHNAFLPYVRAYRSHEKLAEETKQQSTQETRRAQPVKKDNSSSGAQKKLADLELSLLQWRESQGVPKVVLRTHESVRECIRQIQGNEMSWQAAVESLQSDEELGEILITNWTEWQEDWKKLIRLASRAETSVFSSQGSGKRALMEYNFWKAVQAALEDLRCQLDSQEVALLLDIFKRGKRHVAASTKLGSTQEIESAHQQVERFVSLCDMLQLNPLYNAQTTSELRDAVGTVSRQMKEALSSTVSKNAFDMGKVATFLNLLTYDICDQLVRVVAGYEETYGGDDASSHGMNLMKSSIEEFKGTISNSIQAIDSWKYTSFRATLAKLAQKFNQTLTKAAVSSKPSERLSQILRRLNELYRFRKDHHELKLVVDGLQNDDTISQKDDSQTSFISQIENAYDVAIEIACGNQPLNDQPGTDLRPAHILDVSSAGYVGWQTAEQYYNSRAERVESGIIKKLRKHLEEAARKSTSEMFTVFSRNKQALQRQNIAAALSQFQQTLLGHIRTHYGDLRKEVNSFWDCLVNYSRRRGVQMYISECAFWLDAANRRAALLETRVKDVVGRNWDNDTSARKLVESLQTTFRKLNIDTIYSAYGKAIEKRSRSLKLRGSILELVKGDSGLELQSNVSAIAYEMYKDLANFQRLGKRFGNVLSYLENAEALYKLRPLIDSVEFCLRSHEYLTTMMTEHVQLLTYDALKEFRTQCYHLLDSRNTSWDKSRSKAKQDIRSFYRITQRLLDASTEADKQVRSVADLLVKFAECQFDLQALNDICDSIRHLLQHSGGDRMFMSAQVWENVVNSALCSIGLYKLYLHMFCWRRILEENVNDETVSSLSTSFNDITHWMKQSSAKDDPLVASLLRFSGITEEKFWKNVNVSLDTVNLRFLADENGLTLQPSVNAVGKAATTVIQRLVNIFLGITGVDNVGDEKRYLARQLKPGSSVTKLYEDVKSMISKTISASEMFVAYVREYAHMWLPYQALWDLDAATLESILGSSLDSWHQVLSELRQARKTLDMSSDIQSFGIILNGMSEKKALATINLREGREHVISRYDTWTRRILSKFSEIAQGSIEELLSSLSSKRKTLEKIQHAFFDDMGQVANAIVTIDDIDKEKVKLESEVSKMIESEKTLKRYRYALPEHWIPAAQVESEWSCLKQALSRRLNEVQTKIPTLRSKILAQDADIQNNCKDLAASWAEYQPNTKSLDPENALGVINKFETDVEKLHKEWDNLIAARNALDIPTNTSSPVSHLKRDIASLKEVWSSLSSICAEMKEVDDTVWSAVDVQPLRDKLRSMLKRMSTFSAATQQYEAFTHVKNEIQERLQLLNVIQDLKSDILEERHWSRLCNSLSIPAQYANFRSRQSLALSSIFSALRQIPESRSKVNQVLSTAQGEHTIGEFIRQIRSNWDQMEFKFTISKDSGRKLIKNFEEITEIIEEDLAGIENMEQSPYFSTFGGDILYWKERLETLYSILSLLEDAQRKWIHLGSLFKQNATSDLKEHLPREFQRFRSVDAEFGTMLDKSIKQGYVQSLLSIEDAEKCLERLIESMQTIQKSLSHFLHTQRKLFTRLYFVGDEDVLDILANGTNPEGVQPHLRKMFAGIRGLDMEYDETSKGTQIHGVRSLEGEEVQLNFSDKGATRHYVNVDGKVAVTHWLQTLDYAIKGSIAIQVQDFASFVGKNDSFPDNDSNEMYTNITKSMERYAVQVVLIGLSLWWTNKIERLLRKSQSLNSVMSTLSDVLGLMSSNVVHVEASYKRLVWQQILTQLVHDRDVISKLIDHKVSRDDSFEWLKQVRHYGQSSSQEQNIKLRINVANMSFDYGYEYYGAAERLVVTPLTERCFLVLTQALKLRLGGNPFGPAGTGKTESVKALGLALGRLVLVFNCDEKFDFGAVGRILTGLCNVGAWGCFDEFNRLEEKMLSAISGQIQAIQQSLLADSEEVSLLGDKVLLDEKVSIFVTMNPDYAGRSQLPDNLRQLFRPVAMIQPDWRSIAEVTLFGEGFPKASFLAESAVSLFQLCKEQMSPQLHYDFGLRSLKSVLKAAGSLKRQSGGKPTEQHEDVKIFLQALNNSLAPVLVDEDCPIFDSILRSVFPDAHPAVETSGRFMSSAYVLAIQRGFVLSQGWLAKLRQLRSILELRHGVILIGPTGCGKTCLIQTLADALATYEGAKNHVTVIEPKCMPKEQIFGYLDSSTLEWVDGVFTSAIRELSSQQHNQSNTRDRNFIVFDGDVDPVWAENLNSLLDDNKILTLPTGERLALPSRTSIIFEVDSLQYATQATVSRCGMVYMGSAVLSPLATVIRRFRGFGNMFNSVTPTTSCLHSKGLSDQNASYDVAGPGQLLRKQSLDCVCSSLGIPLKFHVDDRERETLLTELSQDEQLSEGAYTSIDKWFDRSEVESSVLSEAMSFCRRNGDEFVMPPLSSQLVSSFCKMIQAGIIAVENSDVSSINDELTDRGKRFLKQWAILSLMWSFSSGATHQVRESLAKYIAKRYSADLPEEVATDTGTLYSFYTNVESSEWTTWQSLVPESNLRLEEIIDGNSIVTTSDVLFHVELIKNWLNSDTPFVLCGPPGSGKTMTLTYALSSLPNIEMVSLNFSSSTSPEFLVRTILQHCKIEKTLHRIVAKPKTPGKSLILFCDEINLPVADDYGTQPVIALMRQIVAQGGFWLSSSISEKIGRSTWNHLTAGQNDDSKVWVSLQKVNIVGACNPPSDPGRVPLSDRFLSLCPVLYVDFPSQASLQQIYSSFLSALFGGVSHLASLVSGLTEAMIDVYSANADHFGDKDQPQYVYSPRELTRWVHSLFRVYYGAMDASEQTTTSSLDLQHSTSSDLVRLWFHEGLRIFSDRIIEQDDQQWCRDCIQQSARRHLASVVENIEEALQTPILYSDWLSNQYESVDINAFREFTSARMKAFAEEEVESDLFCFNEMVEKCLRIDRVLRQPTGHLLLLGEPGSGKTMLTKFVAWMRGLKIFELKVSKKYTLEDFDKDLRQVLIRGGTSREKICFLVDGNDVSNSAFLERMNSLLASGDIPGLFEGEDYQKLLANTKRAIHNSGETVEGEEQMYAWFVRQVQWNVHVVFMLNSTVHSFRDHAAASPALFNRCVVNWLGNWDREALVHVSLQYLENVDLNLSGQPEELEDTGDLNVEELLQLVIAGREQFHGTTLDVGTYLWEDVIATALIRIHELCRNQVSYVKRTSAVERKEVTMVTPRQFIDFAQYFFKLFKRLRAKYRDLESHVTRGLETIRSTETSVASMQKELSEKSKTLETKKTEANEKLQEMVSKQQDAESRRETSKQLAEELEEKQKELKERRDVVEKDLAKAEPALKEAQESVKGIQRSHLDELKAMGQPPEPVKLTLEAVMVMLDSSKSSGSKPTWNEIRRAIQQRDFISNVINFSSDSITSEAKQRINDHYKKHSSFTYDRISAASKACGPLYLWIVSQIDYSDILEKVNPLRTEMEELESAQNKLTTRKQNLDAEIGELEHAIQDYKNEYAALIKETESIKTEIERVENRVDRSQKLLSSLESEKVRWESQQEDFESATEHLVGHCLLASAFVVYCGPLDYQLREKLISYWKQLLSELNMNFDDTVSLPSFVLGPATQVAWHAEGLSNDDVSTNNALILAETPRYPVLVDPSGEAINWIKANLAKHESSTSTEHKKGENSAISSKPIVAGHNKLATASFADGNFVKKLTSALRFGQTILIYDLEEPDPLVNPLLNHEFSRTSGRVTINLVGQEVDVSPSFHMMFAAYDTSSLPSSGFLSRTTVINFTVTQSSLRAQCSSVVMQHERPDAEKKRSELTRLQATYEFKLRSLEEELLDQLSQQNKDLLEDDEVASALEQLKKDSTDLSKKKADTDAVMKDVEAVAQEYSPLTRALADFITMILRLSQLDSIYQFSPAYCFDCLNSCLSVNTESYSKSCISSPDSDRILRLLGKSLYYLYTNVARGMYDIHKSSLAVGCVEIFCKCAGVEKPSEEINALLLGATKSATKDKIEETKSAVESILPNENETVQADRAKQLAAFESMQSFPLDRLLEDMQSNVDQWKLFVESTAHHARSTGLLSSLGDLPCSWLSSDVMSTAKILHEGKQCSPTRMTGVLKAIFQAILVTNVFKEELVASCIDELVELALGKEMLSDIDISLSNAIGKVATAHSPLMLLSTRGYDPSKIVEEIGNNKMKKSSEGTFVSVSMGSQEAFDLAEKYIYQGMRNGDWVLIRNVHLTPGWLRKLRKTLAGSNPDKGFRLIVTAETTRGVITEMPRPFVENCVKIVFEPPAGIKAAALRAMELVDVSRWNKKPVERSRLYFMAVWIHSIIQERRRYVPVGWTRTIDFNDADLTCAIDTIDSWLTHRGFQDVAHVDPAALPWDALRDTFKTVVYGGRLDDEFDAKILNHLTTAIMQESAFKADFSLGTLLDYDDDSKTYNRKTILWTPDTSFQTHQSILKWFNELERGLDPNLLGLSPAVKIFQNKQRARQLIQGWKLLRESAIDHPSRSGDTNEEDVAFQTNVHTGEIVDEWLNELSSRRNSLDRPTTKVTVSADATALLRWLDREYHALRSLIDEVIQDLNAVKHYLEGHTIDPSVSFDRVQKLLRYFDVLQVPPEWLHTDWLSTSQNTPNLLRDWLQLLRKRLDVVTSLEINAIVQGKTAIDIGVFSFPKSLVTSLSQYAANLVRCSLSEIAIHTGKTGDQESFAVTLRNVGIEYGTIDDNQQLTVNERHLTLLDELPLNFSAGSKQEGVIDVPVYGDETRKLRITDIRVPYHPSLSAKDLEMRHVAFVTGS